MFINLRFFAHKGSQEVDASGFRFRHCCMQLNSHLAYVLHESSVLNQNLQVTIDVFQNDVKRG